MNSEERQQQLTTALAQLILPSGIEIRPWSEADFPTIQRLSLAEGWTSSTQHPRSLRRGKETKAESESYHHEPGTHSTACYFPSLIRRLLRARVSGCVRKVIYGTDTQGNCWAGKGTGAGSGSRQRLELCLLQPRVR